MQQQHRAADDHVRQHQPDVAPVGRRQPAEDPAVHLADDVVVALQHERLDRGGQRRDRDAGEHQRDAGATGAERRRRPGTSAAPRAGRRRTRPAAADRPASPSSSPGRARTRSSRRAPHRPRRRAGTDRRAGCGTRPGSWRPASDSIAPTMPASATRGMRTFQTMFQLAVPQLPAGPIMTPRTSAPASNSDRAPAATSDRGARRTVRSPRSSAAMRRRSSSGGHRRRSRSRPTTIWMNSTTRGPHREAMSSLDGDHVPLLAPR